MAKKKSEGYLSARESRRISRENRRITTAYEKKRKRKNVPESEYLTTMKDPRNAVEFDDLHTHFFTDAGVVKAVDGVSFEVPIGKTVGVVGESGCGKSVTSLSLMQLLQRPQGQVVGGSIRLNLGDKAYDVAKMPDEKVRNLRGNFVSMIFQEPMTSLNPVFRIGEQINEVIELHEGTGKTEAEIKARTIELLEMVGIANSEGVYRMYPHELSGGMRQRVCIAMALACNPRLIIADEPTTALDVTIQAQVLDMMKKLREQNGTSMLMITHDLGIVAEVCDCVSVIYAGRVVEHGTLEDVFDHTLHPYTKGLFNSLPNMKDRKARLQPIPGLMPDPSRLPEGCAFADRCRYATDRCFHERPEVLHRTEEHTVACHLYTPENIPKGGVLDHEGTAAPR